MAEIFQMATATAATITIPQQCASQYKGYTQYTHRIYYVFSTTNFNHKEHKPSARPSKPQIIFVSLFEIEHDYDEEKKKSTFESVITRQQAVSVFKRINHCYAFNFFSFFLSFRLMNNMSVCFVFFFFGVWNVLSFLLFNESHFTLTMKKKINHKS